MKERWKKQKFNRLCVRGMVETLGYVRGIFGIHHDGHYWNITHKPSGLNFSHRLFISTLKQAKVIVESAEYAFDWDIPVKEIQNNVNMKQFIEAWVNA